MEPKLEQIFAEITSNKTTIEKINLLVHALALVTSHQKGEGSRTWPLATGRRNSFSVGIFLKAITVGKQSHHSWQTAIFITHQRCFSILFFFLRKDKFSSSCLQLHSPIKGMSIHMEVTWGSLNVMDRVHKQLLYRPIFVQCVSELQNQ